MCFAGAEEGRLTDGQGRTTMFSETVVIATSNLGAEYLLTAAIGERERSLVMDKVHRFCVPNSSIGLTILFSSRN